MRLFRLRGTAVAFLAVLVIPTPSRTAQADKKDPPSFSVLAPGYTYNRSNRIGEMDFRNFILHVFDEQGEIVFSPTLIDGRHRSETKVGKAQIHDDVQLRSVHYIGELEPPKHALVEFYWISVGATLSCHAYVQLLEAGQNGLKVVQQVAYNCKSSAGAFYDESTKTLTVKATHYSSSDAMCCPSKLDIVSFRWTGSRFEQQSIETVPLQSNDPQPKPQRPKKSE